MNGPEKYRIALEARSLTWFAILCALFTYPVIAADIMHRDDLWRVISGQYAWAQHGRPMADLVTQILSLSGSAIIDAAPFAQVVFGLCLFVSFVLTQRYFQRDYDQSLGLALGILFLNPFFLGNILYQFDALGMGLAIAVTTAAFVLVPRFQPFTFVCSIGAFAVVLALYQPTLNLLIGLCAVQLAASAVKGDALQALLRILAFRASQFIAGYVLYYVVIGLQLHDVSERSSIVSLDAEGARMALENAARFSSFVADFFKSDSPGFVAVFVIFGGLGVVSIAIATLKVNTGAGVLLGGALLALAVSVLSFFGPLVVIDDVLVAFRTIPSAFAPLSVFAVFLLQVRNLWFAALLPIFAAIVLSFQTMAVYKSQRAFDMFVAQSVASDMNAARMSTANLYTFGAVPTAPQAEHGRMQHRMIHDLADPAKHWILEGLLIQYGLVNTVPLWTRDRALLQARFAEYGCDRLQVIVQTDLYSIIEADGTAFVFLPNSPMFPCLQKA
jgi:hypothetical protein